jgi:hypothetical protein
VLDLGIKEQEHGKRVEDDVRELVEECVHELQGRI